MSGEMEFVQNFPCFSIMFCMFAGIVSSAFKEKMARIVNVAVLTLNILLSAAVFLYVAKPAYRMFMLWDVFLRPGAMNCG